MNILSLFDGISCGHVALERANIKVDNYYASEIDKYAISVTQYNYSETIQLGDINNWENWNLQNIDLIIGGSPCQGFSMAGKQLNFNDPRSKLFFKFVDILEFYKPKYFLLENVVMKKEYQDVITKYLKIEPIMINSSLLSAQNRKRLYWTNIPDIVQPEDKRIYLKDIIEYGIVDKEKSYCIDANYFKGGNLEQYFQKHRRQLVFDKPEKIMNIGKGGQGQRIYNIEGKSVTLSALGGGQGAKTGLYVVNPCCVVGRRINKEGHREDYNKNIPITQCLQVKSNNEKSGCLTTVEKDNLLSSLPPDRYIDFYNRPDLSNYVRKLTPIECERLQTLNDNYTQFGIDSKNNIVNISNSQRYKMLGNGWTVNIIVHILKNIQRVN